MDLINGYMDLLNTLLDYSVFEFALISWFVSSILWLVIQFLLVIYLIVKIVRVIIGYK